MRERAEQTRPGRNAAIRDTLTIAILLALLVLPGLRATLDGWHAELPDELRPPAPFPSLAATSAFPRRFEAFFDDRFGFRRELIRAHNRAKIDLLGSSPIDRVLLGRDRWFYLRVADHDRAAQGWVRHRQGAPRLRKGEERSWRRMLQHRSNTYGRNGVRYLFVVAPDKHTIYPEHLPASVDVRRRTAIDQLAPVLAADGVSFLDLRPALRAAKPTGRLYWQTGTHWTALGAKVVDDAIVRALSGWFDELNPRPLAQHRLRLVPGTGHGLARMLHLRDHYREPTPELTAATPNSAVQLDEAEMAALAGGETLRDLPLRIFETGNRALPIAVVVVDSFGEALHPFLSEHFERTLLVHRMISPARLAALIEWQQPDLVIDEIVERNVRGRAGPR